MYFITGNNNKFLDAQRIISTIQQLNIDLPEIQDVDPQKIIEAKLMEAKKHYDGDFFVEDTSLYFDCLNGLPGPFIKWFLDKLGQDGLYEIVKKLGNQSAAAKTVIGYMDAMGNVMYFVGEVQGTIVEPLVPTHFGWNSIFKPLGSEKTFAEMVILKEMHIVGEELLWKNLETILGSMSP